MYNVVWNIENIITEVIYSLTLNTYVAYWENIETLYRYKYFRNWGVKNAYIQHYVVPK